MCKICETQSDPFGRAVALGKYNVQYFRCATCGFIETEHPYWLQEAYGDAIAFSDLGLIGRNVRFAPKVQVLIRLLSKPSGKFVDYGGGYGIFTRLMRDAGFDFYRQDRYCRNLFAAGFDAEQGSCDYDLLTAFEVFEHLVDPVAELSEMLKLSRTVLFSTLLVPRDKPPQPNSWWYYALETGQHVAFYTRESLALLASRFGLRFFSMGGFHLMTDQQIHPLLYRLSVIAAHYLPPPVFGETKSLLSADYAHIVRHKPS